MIWGIKWHIVEKMMADAPYYKYNSKSHDKPDKKSVKHEKSLRDMMNNLIAKQKS